MEKGIPVDALKPSNWPVGMSLWPFLLLLTAVGGLSLLLCFHPLQMGLDFRRKLSKHDAGSKPASIIATSVSSSSSSLTSLDAKMNPFLCMMLQSWCPSQQQKHRQSKGQEKIYVIILNFYLQQWIDHSHYQIDPIFYIKVLRNCKTYP